MTTTDQPIPCSDASLQQQVHELTAVVHQLSAELHSMRASMPAPAPVPDASAPLSGSRRQMLQLAGAAAVGAVVSVAAFGDASPVAANTNQPLNTGYFNFAQNTTVIRNQTGANTSLVAGTLATDDAMFWADNTLSSRVSAVGLRGDGREGGSGVEGHGGVGVSGVGAVIGVLGTSIYGVRGQGTAIGIEGIGSGPNAFGVSANGNRSAVILGGSNVAPPLRADAHNAGEIDIDLNNNVWLCVANGSPGQWRMLGGPTTAGALHAIDPVRAFDSRWTGNTRLTTGASNVVSVADAHDPNGVVTVANAVPAGATAVAYNLTITQTVGSGFLSVAPGTAATSTASSINWAGTGLNLANGLIVATDGSRQIKVFCGGGGSTDYVVDITGYFR